MNRHLQRLDRLPAPLALAAGVGVAALAVALMAVAPAAGGVAFVALLAGAVWLAFTGEPIAIPLEAARGEAAEPAAPPAQKRAPTPGPGAHRPTRSDPHEPVLAWVSIPSGTFQMGSLDNDNEQPVHAVTVSAFECMSVPVTRRLYRAVMGDDPGWPEGDADARPVNNVSWLDAVAFCNRWSERAGLSSCYRIDGSSVTWDRSKNGYRLLSEAEWEYACRAGSGGRWCFGDDEAQLNDYAWFRVNSGTTPHPVAQKRANAWGLYDMHGNVYEWCWDRYGPYAASDQIDPDGPPDAMSRVLRGGAFGGVPWDLRSANRGGIGPEGRGWVIGFRCARAPAAGIED